jgi:hypothetical protein
MNLTIILIVICDILVIYNRKNELIIQISLYVLPMAMILTDSDYVSTKISNYLQHA